MTARQPSRRESGRQVTEIEEIPSREEPEETEEEEVLISILNPGGGINWGTGTAGVPNLNSSPQESAYSQFPTRPEEEQDQEQVNLPGYSSADPTKELREERESGTDLHSDQEPYIISRLPEIPSPLPSTTDIDISNLIKIDENSFFKVSFDMNATQNLSVAARETKVVLKFTFKIYLNVPSLLDIGFLPQSILSVIVSQDFKKSVGYFDLLFNQTKDSLPKATMDGQLNWTDRLMEAIAAQENPGEPPIITTAPLGDFLSLDFLQAFSGGGNAKSIYQANQKSITFKYSLGQLGIETPKTENASSKLNLEDNPGASSGKSEGEPLPETKTNPSILAQLGITGYDEYADFFTTDIRKPPAGISEMVRHLIDNGLDPALVGEVPFPLQNSLVDRQSLNSDFPFFNTLTANARHNVVKLAATLGSINDPNFTTQDATQNNITLDVIPVYLQTTQIINREKLNALDKDWLMEINIFNTDEKGNIIRGKIINNINPVQALKLSLLDKPLSSNSISVIQEDNGLDGVTVKILN